VVAATNFGEWIGASPLAGRKVSSKSSERAFIFASFFAALFAAAS